MTSKRRESTAEQAYTNGHGVAAFFAPEADTSNLGPTGHLQVPICCSPYQGGGRRFPASYLVPRKYKKYQIYFRTLPKCHQEQTD
jgi:hypothetical protein